MKQLILYFLLTLCTVVSAQKQFLVEYDRIKNTESYYELKYNKGTYTPLPVKRISVNNGDMVRFRGVNVNPLKFKMNVVSPFNSDLPSPIGSVLDGFGKILSESNGSFADVGRELTNLKNNVPELPSFKTRGADLSPQEQMRSQSMAKLSAFHTLLTNTFNTVNAYANITEVAYCTHLSKEEILTELAQKKEGLNNREYEASIRQLKKSFAVIKNDPLLDPNEYSELLSTYNELLTKVEGTLLSPLKIDELISEISAASFSQEQTLIVGYERDEFSFDKQSGFSDYTIEFSDINDSQESNYEKDGLLQNHRISLPFETPSNFSWATGGIYVSPFGGFTSFKINASESGDSIRVVDDGNGSKGRITLGTSLQYNFASSKSIIPHALFGISVGFLTDSYEKPISFLLGGGVKLRKFQFISLSAGVSFCENRATRAGVALNKYYGTAATDSEERLDILTKRVFSPGLFLGININL
jgi:hypothetical protein